MNGTFSGWKNGLSKFILSALLIAPLAIAAPQTEVTAAGTTYYVATNGSDANNGTSVSTPFLTIQKAAFTAQAGDTVTIRGGTYRETVTPIHSGNAGNKITYQNYSGETVIVSGSDVVSGWTLDSGNVYKAPMNWILGAGNQVFVNGTMMEEARWPNQTGTLISPTRATAGAGTDATHIADANLPGGTGFWNGATVWTTSGSGFA